MSHKQGFRVELAPTQEQAILMGRHCGLSRVVENFCLETVQKKKAQQEAEKTYGITGDDLTKVPWSAPALEREWRAAHPERYPWFADGKLSSRVPKEACRVRAAGITCGHPALPAEDRIALSLRCLGGLTTTEVARAFLVSAATMAKRIVRAKKKIREARIPFRVPAAADLLSRLGRRAEAADAYRRALELAGTEPERAHLRRRLASTES